jgi:hypothetical protein
MRKIFLSSTAKDLGSCCAELARALNALEGWHCVWMGDFNASDTASVVRRTFRSAGSEISFTQHEDESAVTKGMTRLF